MTSSSGEKREKCLKEMIMHSPTDVSVLFTFIMSFLYLVVSCKGYMLLLLDVSDVT